MKKTGSKSSKIIARTMYFELIGAIPLCFKKCRNDKTGSRSSKTIARTMHFKTIGTISFCFQKWRNDKTGSKSSRMIARTMHFKTIGTISFFTVLCFSVTDFRRGARREICGYFNVQIWSNSRVGIRTYRANAHHTRVSAGPDEVPYPIEPTRSVLCRHTIGFHVGPREPGVKVTWRRPRRRRP